MADPVLPQLYIPPEVLSRERLNYQRGFKLLTLPTAAERAASRAKVAPPPASTGDRAPQRMGNARQPGHKPALRFVGDQLVNEGLYPVPGADFNAAATPWERRWSNLCTADGLFTPVVRETEHLEVLGMGTVAGHRGRVMGYKLAQFGTPTRDRKNGWLGGDGLVFVNDPRTESRPPGAVTFGGDQYVYDVLTTVDGQVLAILGTEDRQALQGANWVIDLVLAPLLAPVMISMAYGAARMGSALVAHVEARLARNVLAGPTKELVERVAVREVAAAAPAVAPGGYSPITGMTPKHHQAFVQAADETGAIIVVRHTNQKSIPLIERGCPGKPKDLEFINTSPDTGIVMANTAKEVTRAKELGYFVVGEGNTARRLVRRGNDYVHEDMTVSSPFWKLEKGQVIDPVTRKPIVGDYDLMGVIDPKAPGRVLALVSKNKGELVTDLTNPFVQKVAKAVNDKMEMKRVLHGPQDFYKGFRKGASAFEPGGKVQHFPTEEGVEAYYKSLGRQPRNGQHPRPDPKTPVEDQLAKERARRANKPTGWR